MPFEQETDFPKSVGQKMWHAETAFFSLSWDIFPHKTSFEILKIAFWMACESSPVPSHGLATEKPDADVKTQDVITRHEKYAPSACKNQLFNDSVSAETNQHTFSSSLRAVFSAWSRPGVGGDHLLS
jgi:hypothetical protein